MSKKDISFDDGLTMALEAIDRIHADGPFEVSDNRQRGRDVATVKWFLRKLEKSAEDASKEHLLAVVAERSRA